MKPYGRKWRRTEERLDESERGERKTWLKAQHSENKGHGIMSHHFMASKWENWTVTDFIVLGSKKTAGCDCSHEIKRCLLLGRKVMTNLDSMLRSREITLSTKVCLVKAMFFPVVMCGCDSWSIRKLSAEELMLLNCGVGADSWESIGQQGDPTSAS